MAKRRGAAARESLRAVKETLSAPFPYFGGKSRVADLVWQRLGEVRKYVEPFAGSAATLLRRPAPAGRETINDVNHYLVNFWRAVKANPRAVAKHAAWPIAEADLHARHRYLLLGAPAEEFRRRIEKEPKFCDPEFAGYWVWGMSTWIAGGWCDLASLRKDGEPTQPRPNESTMGVNAASRRDRLPEIMRQLSERLQRVAVCYGHWKRVCDSPSTMRCRGVTGAFVDPPYAKNVERMHAWVDALEGRGDAPPASQSTNRADGLYAGERACDIDRVVAEVHLWCRKWGFDSQIRIALCGYAGEHDALEDLGWTVMSWKAQGGYSNRSGPARNGNCRRERIWFSPACLAAEAARARSRAA